MVNSFFYHKKLSSNSIVFQKDKEWHRASLNIPSCFVEIQCVAHKNYTYGHIPNQAIISKVAKPKINMFYWFCFVLNNSGELIFAKQMVFSDIYCQVFLKKVAPQNFEKFT